MKKKGFTLVEMLVVVVVLVTLMSVTFKLSSIGDDQKRRTLTIERLQRLENCLSGYYAAFGSYPPVRLHGSRNYNLEANLHGIQSDNERQLSFDWFKTEGNHGIGSESELRDWRQVEAACRSQPVAVRAPVPEGCNELIVAKSELAKERRQNGEDTNTEEDHVRKVSAGWDDGWTTDNGSRFNARSTDSSWQAIQLFQFGVLSFLLPRYQIMLNGPDKFFTQFAQWTANNTLPMDPLGAGWTFSGWSDVRESAERARQRNGDYKRDLARIAQIPSQAACARWLPNLENSCIELGYVGTTSFYGIDVRASENSYLADAGDSGIYAPGDATSSSTSQQYMLGGLTLADGWGHELYYYSPSPHQGYVVWSAGENGRTFPPWVSREALNPNENQCVSAWIGDDIVHMSN